MKQKYIKPEIKKIEYTYEEAYGKKCDFALQSDGCYGGELQYK
jgi:hypothetical protein